MNIGNYLKLIDINFKNIVYSNYPTNRNMYIVYVKCQYFMRSYIVIFLPQKHQPAAT